MIISSELPLYLVKWHRRGKSIIVKKELSPEVLALLFFAKTISSILLESLYVMRYTLELLTKLSLSEITCQLLCYTQRVADKVSSFVWEG